MVEKVQDIDFLECESEVDALLKEALLAGRGVRELVIFGIVLLTALPQLNVMCRVIS